MPEHIRTLEVFQRIDALISAGSIAHGVRPLLQAAMSETAEPTTRLDLAKVLFQTDSKTEARDLTRIVLEEVPSSSEAQFLYGGILYSLYDYPAVIAALTSYLDQTERSTDALDGKIQVLLERAKTDSGRDPDTHTDPLYPCYAEAYQRLNKATPEPIANSVDESIFTPWQKRLLAAYRTATRSGLTFGKSEHWDRFRDDFERVIATASIWPRFRQFGLTHGLDDDLIYVDPARPFMPVTGKTAPTLASPAPVCIARLCERTDRVLKSVLDVIPQERVTQLSETEIGDPVRFQLPLLDVPVNYHDLTCLFYADRIAHHAPAEGNLRILEIGGGYGVMAAQLKILNPSAQTVLVDLPESSAFQYYYLSQRFPEASILTVNDLLENCDALQSDWDFIVLPNSARDLIKGLEFDMAINVRSFMEMEIETVQDYIRWFDDAIRPDGICYLANRIEKLIAGTAVRFVDYAIPDDWTLESEQSIPIQPHIQEWVFRTGR